MTPTKIDIEKLKKLVRLATNNPNEHEANLAAIKVCRMLLENDFACLNPNPLERTKTPDFKSTRQSPTGRGWDGFDFDEIFRNMQAQQAKARQQSYDRETRNRPGNPYGSYSGFNPDAIYENQCEKCHQRFVVPRADYKEYGWVCAVCRNKARANPDIHYSPYTSARPPRPEKKIRKCVQCGKEVETKRVTSVFRCNECEWNDFENHPKKKKATVPNCSRCKNSINIYDGATATWRCVCGASYISEVEAASRGIKFT